MDGRSWSDDARVGAAAVCKRGDRWKAFRCHLGTGRMEVYGAELWAIGLALRESVRKTDTLQTHGVTKVAVFRNSHAAIRSTEHPELGPGQPLARWINQSSRPLREAGIKTEIHCVPGHTGIPRNEEADHQANLARGGCRTGTVRERVDTSAANRTRRISEAQTAEKAEWEADKCSNHQGYRAERQSWEQETHPNEQREASGNQILPNEVQTRPSGHVPKTVQTLRRWQMLVVQWPKQDSPDAGTSLPPLQSMERPAEHALERSGKSDGMESGQMPTRESLWAALHREMRPSGDGFLGGNWCQEIPAQHERRSKSRRATGGGVSASGQRAEEYGPAGNGRRIKGRQALLDFIPFLLYYISATLGCFLSFVRRGQRIVGVELHHRAGQPGGGGD